MIRNCKKIISIVLVMALSAVVSLPAFAESSSKSKTSSSAAASESSLSDNPLDSGKNILNYLFWTQDTKLEKDLTNLQKSLKLSSDQMAALKALGLKQSQAIEELPETAGAEKYNASVKAQADNTNQAIQSILKGSYPSFRNWIATWWQGEKNYRKNLISQEEAKNSLTPNADITTHTIYATQYQPRSDTGTQRQVALPDKDIKFANLGDLSSYEDPPYTVYLSSSAGSISDVAVNEVGPRNEDDNYWDNDRREWTGELSLGTPETYAAYYDNFNGGPDEFGREVINPAGIDLSPTVARPCLKNRGICIISTKA